MSKLPFNIHYSCECNQDPNMLLMFTMFLICSIFLAHQGLKQMGKESLHLLNHIFDLVIAFTLISPPSISIALLQVLVLRCHLKMFLSCRVPGGILFALYSSVVFQESRSQNISFFVFKPLTSCKTADFPKTLKRAPGFVKSHYWTSHMALKMHVNLSF